MAPYVNSCVVYLIHGGVIQLLGVEPLTGASRGSGTLLSHDWVAFFDTDEYLNLLERYVASVYFGACSGGLHHCSWRCLRVSEHVYIAHQ